MIRTDLKSDYFLVNSMGVNLDARMFLCNDGHCSLYPLLRYAIAEMCDHVIHILTIATLLML
jgi:hypothetical protein